MLSHLLIYSSETHKHITKCFNQSGFCCPFFLDDPVVVEVGFWILSIEKIDVLNMVCCKSTDELIVYFRAVSNFLCQNCISQQKIVGDNFI